MTAPEPDSTNRIIAAQREEARKTRTLLLWIFVGLPMISGIIWLLVVLAASGNANHATADSSFDDGSVSTTDENQGGDQGGLAAPTFSEALETTESSVTLSDLQSYVGKSWSALPQDVLGQTIQVDPWGNIITELPSIVPNDWVVSSVNTNTNLTLVMKPIGDPAAAGDPFVHTVVYAASGHGTANISYTTSSADEPMIVDRRLPWSLKTTVESSSIDLTVLNDDFDPASTVSCSITVDGQLVAQSTSSESSSGVASCDYSAPVTP